MGESNLDKANLKRKRALYLLILIFSLITAAMFAYQIFSTAEEDDLFYISFGLYAENTHECYYHNPGSCDAEFKSLEVTYHVKSRDTPYEVQGRQKTTDKGWLDFYLPKNQNFLVEFEVEGMRGSGVVSTVDGAPTCIATIQMKP